MVTAAKEQWRWWLPRGIELADSDPEHANVVADLINNQRRRSLGYKSPVRIYSGFIVR